MNLPSSSLLSRSVISITQKPLLRFLLIRIPITLGLTIIFYVIGSNLLPYSGDGSYIADMNKMNWAVLMHAVLTSLVNKAVYTILNPWGWNPWFATSMSSAIAGALAVQVLYAIRPDPIFMAINILSGSFLVFVGEVEIYAWVNLFLLLTFLYMERYLNKEIPLWPVTSCYYIACLFHMMSFFYLPMIFWAMKKRQDFQAWEFLVPFFVFMTTAFGCNFLLEHRGFEINYTRLVPIFKFTRKGQHFTFFTWAHLAIKTKFHFQAAFLGIPLEWPLVIYFRKNINTLFKQFLLYTSIIGLIWTTVWHPDLGPLDWDLFSQMGISLHILLGILVTEWFQERRKYSKSLPIQ